jgi:hypothetical protein
MGFCLASIFVSSEASWVWPSTRRSGQSCCCWFCARLARVDGAGSLGVRRSAARLLLTKRELSRFADGLRSKVREAHADKSDASRRRENRPDQVECDFT